MRRTRVYYYLAFIFTVILFVTLFYFYKKFNTNTKDFLFSFREQYVNIRV